MTCGWIHWFEIPAANSGFCFFLHLAARINSNWRRPRRPTTDCANPPRYNVTGDESLCFIGSCWTWCEQAVPGSHCKAEDSTFNFSCKRSRVCTVPFHPSLVLCHTVNVSVSPTQKKAAFHPSAVHTSFLFSHPVSIVHSLSKDTNLHVAVCSNGWFVSFYPQGNRGVGVTLWFFEKICTI